MAALECFCRSSTSFVVLLCKSDSAEPARASGFEVCTPGETSRIEPNIFWGLRVLGLMTGKKGSYENVLAGNRFQLSTQETFGGRWIFSWSPRLSSPPPPPAWSSLHSDQISPTPSLLPKFTTSLKDHFCLKLVSLFGC